MKFTVNDFVTVTYDMSYEQLIRECAWTNYDYVQNAYYDGNITEPPNKEVFANDLYNSIVNGEGMDMALDDTIIWFTFPEEVRFLGKDKIIKIIIDTLNELY